MSTDLKTAGRKGRLASPWNRNPNCGTLRADAVKAEFNHRRPPRYVGDLDGDLALMAEAIRESIIHHKGEEFLVWADDDGMVFVAPDSTDAARKAQLQRPAWLINNYRSRWDIAGVRTYLTVDHIREDLQFHRDERVQA